MSETVTRACLLQQSINDIGDVVFMFHSPTCGVHPFVIVCKGFCIDGVPTGSSCDLVMSACLGWRQAPIRLRRVLIQSAFRTKTPNSYSGSASWPSIWKCPATAGVPVSGLPHQMLMV